MAIDYDEMEIARWLLDHGASPNARATMDADGFGGHTPLFSSVVSQVHRAWHRNDDRYTRLLLERGADPNVRASLRKRLQDLDDQRLNAPVRIDEGVIEAHIAELDQVLGQDPEAANAFFRDNVKVRCLPMERHGRRFYRASGEANGAEIIKSLGLAQAFDFGGCGGWI